MNDRKIWPTVHTVWYKIKNDLAILCHPLDSHIFHNFVCDFESWRYHILASHIDITYWLDNRWEVFRKCYSSVSLLLKLLRYLFSDINWQFLTSEATINIHSILFNTLHIIYRIYRISLHISYLWCRLYCQWSLLVPSIITFCNLILKCYTIDVLLNNFVVKQLLKLCK